ncbi:MAG: acetyl-CoA carboxylase biotin carboxylase subunit [candidate division Zixibacteria bacterium]|nr:acetyl-CoA carboxylase biotin carboxylase subunit [candidate division Zixibacteria bacterium]
MTAKRPAKIHRVLIANRGEIAVRVIRGCRRLGIESVAVYSDADRAALHVRMADWAYGLGAPPPEESYLNIPKILEAARAAKADAIHPGYGFLAENARFAERVAEAGLIWIGPPPHAISTMGDKIAARTLMIKAGAPVVPGSDGPITDAKSALAQAEKAGFPIVIKAVAGGGGKGMRVVREAADWQPSIDAARREAKGAFADDRVYWEKYLEKPRHVEIQILADRNGRAISLNERECSIQRRHQKVIEESPSVAVNPDLRARMGKAAIAAAESCGYVGAGTVEFLLDTDGKFYFLEMNTRLQVEHPVTEWVTGVDLVAEQLRIAGDDEWNPPSLSHAPFGHAIQFRIYAEDPQNNFLPSPGTISTYSEPQGPGVRVDSGVYQGSEIPIFYDPMVAKLIVWGRDRSEAVAAGNAALEEFHIDGIATTIDFHRQIIHHPEFIAGNTTTDFIARHFKSTEVHADGDEPLQQAVAVAAALYTRRRVGQATRVPSDGNGQTTRYSGWLVDGRRRGTDRWPVRF